MEHETRGTFEPEGATSEELEPEKAFVPEPEADESGKDSSDDESEPELDQGGQSGAYQEAPAAVRKPYHSFTGAPQPITQSRERSGRDAASLQAPMRAVDVNHLPPEPTTLCEAQASPEWPNWQRARKSEMDEQLARQTSIRMVLGIAAVKDWEFPQLDVDMAYLEAGIEEEPYIEQPQDYRDSCDQVGRLQEAMYGLVHAELLRSKKFSAELATRGFEQCQTDPCVFRRVLRGRVVIIIVVYVDDLLVASETKRDEEQAMKDLRSCFPIKDLGEAELYLGCHITRDRDAGTLKLDQHPLRADRGFEIQRREDEHHTGSSGSKTLFKDDAPQTEAETEEMRVTSYWEAVETLMWAATMTRPDVAYAAHQLGKINDSLEPVHWGASKRALQYLWRWDHLRRNAGVVHKNFGMNGRRFCHLPRHSAFGFRRSGDAEEGARSVGSRGCRR